MDEGKNLDLMRYVDQTGDEIIARHRLGHDHWRSRKGQRSEPQMQLADSSMWHQSV